MRTRIITAVLAVPLIAAAAPRQKTPARAVPAVPAQPEESAKPSEPLINSDLNGRDLLFITQAIDLGKALAFLAEQSPRAADPSLRGFGDELVKTLAAQSAVLNTVAEMRKLRIPQEQSNTEMRIARRCSGLEGIKLDKALLDAFLEVDRKAVAAYELGLTSKDPTIQKLAEQTLPQIREHLLVVQAMAGISSTQTEHATAPARRDVTQPEPVPPPIAESSLLPSPGMTPVSAALPRPGFRTNVRLPSDTAPTTGQ
jgi:hypothetical protein